MKDGKCSIVKEMKHDIDVEEESGRMVYDPWLQRYIDINTGIRYMT
jgi:hypothetical protein